MRLYTAFSMTYVTNYHILVHEDNMVGGRLTATGAQTAICRKRSSSTIPILLTLAVRICVIISDTINGKYEHENQKIDTHEVRGQGCREDALSLKYDCFERSL